MKSVGPKENPNAYAALGSGSVAGFLIFEAHARFGIDFNIPEQTMLVAIVAAIYLFFGKKVKE